MRMVDAGVDYLRITVKPCKGLKTFSDAWNAEMDLLKSQGAKQTRWWFKGYDGRRVDDVMRGSRDDSHIFEACGPVCQRLYESIKGVEFNGNFPRVDAGIAIEDKTETFIRPVPLFKTIDDEDIRTQRKRRRREEVIKGKNGADTLAFNKRGGGIFTRYYDAHAAHPEVFGSATYKFECEYKDHTARRVWEQFLAGESQQQVAAGLVLNQLAKMDLEFPFYDLAPPVQIRSGYKPPDIERALRWFANQVRPKIRWLVEMGYGDVVAQCLGVKSIELIEISRDEAISASLAPRLNNIGVISGCESDTPKRRRIGLYAPIHSKAGERKKLKKGGLDN